MYEEDAVLYAISGRNPEKLQAFQQEHPCEKIYIGHDNLLKDPMIDAVYIGLPHDMHREWALKAIQAHKAVLCEKPAVLNEREMQEIVDASHQEQVLFMEAMKSRFEPAYIKTKQLLAEDTIGSITSIKAQISSVFPKEKYEQSYITKPVVGGALLDTGCYCVNWVNDLLKEEPVVQNVSCHIVDSVDYFVDASLQFGNVDAEIIAGIDRKMEPLTEIIGTKGKILVEKPHRPDRIHIQRNGEGEIIFDVPYVHDDFYGQVHHFNELFKKGQTESDVMSLSDSLRNAHLLDLIHHAIHA
jgi:predicted dehydrogenase